MNCRFLKTSLKLKSVMLSMQLTSVSLFSLLTAQPSSHCTEKQSPLFSYAGNINCLSLASFNHEILHSVDNVAPHAFTVIISSVLLVSKLSTNSTLLSLTDLVNVFRSSFHKWILPNSFLIPQPLEYLVQLTAVVHV